MTDEILPKEIKWFLLRHIDSIAQLEGLLLLHKDPDKEWTAKALAHGLFIDESQASAIILRLFEQGFITETENEFYCYQPKSPELADMVNQLADLYRRYLVPITNLIHTKSQSRVQEFANAFRIRKD